MAFTHKKLNVQFNLANGNFAGGGNTANISGLRVSAQIQNAGGSSSATMALAVYGLPLTLMNQLSTVGRNYGAAYKNGVAVYAGDDESGMTLVFQGNIFSAFVDAAAMPQVCLRVQASPGTYHAVKPATPISRSGQVPAADLMQDLAKVMGFGFENAGVTAKLTNPYYGGTAWTQALQIADHAGFNMGLDRNTMAIVPPANSREGDAVLISPGTGMVGYPQFNQACVNVRALFNPAVKFYGPIQIKSDLPSACGRWKVITLNYDLESETPNGKWFMDITGMAEGPSVA